MIPSFQGDGLLPPGDYESPSKSFGGRTVPACAGSWSGQQYQRQVRSRTRISVNLPSVSTRWRTQGNYQNQIRRSVMIRNEAEYQIASARLLEERNRLAEHRARLKSTNMSDQEIKRVIDPIKSFHLQLRGDRKLRTAQAGRVRQARESARFRASADLSSHCEGHLAERLGSTA
jgi:hypothetical protein